MQALIGDRVALRVIECLGLDLARRPHNLLLPVLLQLLLVLMLVLVLVLLLLLINGRGFFVKHSGVQGTAEGT